MVYEGCYIKFGGEFIYDVEYWKKGLWYFVYFIYGICNVVDSGYIIFLELVFNLVVLMQVVLIIVDVGLYDVQLILMLVCK